MHTDGEKDRETRESVKPHRKRIQLKFSRGWQGSQPLITKARPLIRTRSKEEWKKPHDGYLIPETRATFWTRYQEFLMLFSGEWLMILALSAEWVRRRISEQLFMLRIAALISRSLPRDIPRVMSTFGVQAETFMFVKWFLWEERDEKLLKANRSVSLFAFKFEFLSTWQRKRFLRWLTVPHFCIQKGENIIYLK